MRSHKREAGKKNNSLTLESAQPFPLPNPSEAPPPNGLVSPPLLLFIPNGSSRNGSLANGSVGVAADGPPPPPPAEPPPLLKGSEPKRLGPLQEDCCEGREAHSSVGGGKCGPASSSRAQATPHTGQLSACADCLYT